MKEMFVGFDVHAEELYGTVLNRHGEIVVQGGIPYRKEAVQSFFGGMPSRRVVIAIEACGLWRGAYNLLRDLGYDVVLANPVKVHQIACKKKTDKVDSRILADLLRTGYLPEVYIPSEDVLRLRDLARHRASLVRIRASLKSRIKWYLLRDGVKYKMGWGKKSLEYLKETDPKIANFVRIMEAIDVEIKQVTREVNNIAVNMRLTNLLRTVPGIGNFSSLMILGEIGDIKRFQDPKSLVSYAGLCPGIHQSGDRNYSVVNRACNNWLKWIITECSGKASMLDTRYMRHYHRVKKRKGFKVARRSVARKMLTDIWHMLTKEEPFSAS
ncbi:MAG: IS110 family transposase [Fidelibacterota bacterium]